MDSVDIISEEAVPPLTDAATDTTTPPRQRWGAAMFVVVFLAATLILLTLNRACVNTAFMNWYLYQVANHTADLLGVIGHSGSLEDPDLYNNRAAGIRDSIREWSGHPLQPGTVTNPAEENRPLTSYEIWRYRALRIRHDYDSERKQFALTDTLPTPEFREPSDQLRYSQSCLDQLERSVVRPSPTGPTRVAAPNVQEILTASNKTLKSLEESATSADPSFQQSLNSVTSQIESGRVQQRAFLQSRADQLYEQMHERLGPIVDFVLKPNVDTHIRETQRALETIKRDNSDSAADRATRQQAAEAELASLQQERQKATANGALPPKEKRFRFNVVPDCGALSSIAIFFAALLAFPTSMWKRALGLLIGGPVLYVVNILRLTCLAVIGAWNQAGDIFQFAHEYVWQAIFIIFVVAVWLLWIELIVRPRSTWHPNSP